MAEKTKGREPSTPKPAKKRPRSAPAAPSTSAAPTPRPPPGREERAAFYAPGSGVLTEMPAATRQRLIGEIVELMLASRMHRFYFVNDIDAVFLPPIHLDQFRTYRRRGRLVGLVTWAWLSEEVERAYLGGRYNLRPSDFKSGDRLWAIDFIAPFGDARRIAQDLRQRIFPDRIGKAVRIGRDGAPRGIWKLVGADRRADARAFEIDVTLPNPRFLGPAADLMRR